MSAAHAATEEPSVPSSMAQAKEALRASMGTLRDGLPADVRARASERAAEALARHLEILRPTVVALYAAIRSELDTGPLASALRARGVQLVYPRVIPSDYLLQFRSVDSDQDFTRGTFGILEPSDATPVIPLHQIECFVVPGLAFDANGTRLGWGRGYYDTTLAQHPSVPRIGLGFAAQLVHSIPREARDVPMTELASEHGVVHSRPPS